MAKNGSMLEVKHNIECSVCYEDLVESTPKVLNCGHTFCLNCVIQLNNNTKITCPKCRKSTKLSHGKVDELPTNYELCNLGNKNINLDICEACTRNQLSSKATNFCVDCGRKLCDACVEKHAELPSISSHQIIKLKEFSNKNCTKHKAPITLFCMECNEILCVDCSMSKRHDDHKQSIDHYESSLETLKKRLEVAERNLKELKVKNLAGKDVLQKALDNVQQVKTYVEQVKNSLNGKVSFGAYLLSQVLEADILLQTLDNYEHPIRTVYEDMCNNHVSMEIYENEIMDLLKESDNEIITLGKGYCEICDTLVARTNEHLTKSYAVPRFIQSSNVEESLGKIATYTIKL